MAEISNLKSSAKPRRLGLLSSARSAATSPVKVLTAMEVPVEQPILYPIAAVKGWGNQNRALDFIAFVRSEAGQKILGKYGFLKP